MTIISDVGLKLDNHAVLGSMRTFRSKKRKIDQKREKIRRELVEVAQIDVILEFFCTLVHNYREEKFTPLRRLPATASQQN